MTYSKISFYFAISIYGLLAFIILKLFVFPSLEVCFGFAHVLMVLSPFIAFIGLIFAIAGIKEPDSFQKRFGFIANLIFSIFGVLIIVS